MTAQQLRRSGPVLASFLWAALVIAGCGGAAGRSGSTDGAVKTVTVTKAPTTPSSPPRRSPSRPTTPTTPAPASPTGFVACDANISAKAPATSCPFAENVFYEYWKSGQASSITAYSPTVGSTLDLQCSSGLQVVCTTSSGAAAAFSKNSVAAYSQTQGDQYAATHDVGPGSPPPTGSGGSPSSPTSSTGFCSTHQCIPNFPNGTGSIVQCADGEYSHSGGRPGACSQHGGER